MDDAFSESRLIFPHSLSALGEFLVKLTENTLFPVAIKSIEPNNNLKNQKILLHNKASAEFWGLSDQGMEGRPLLELYTRLSPSDREVHIQRVKTTNQTVLDSHSQSTQTQIILDQMGFVRIYERIVTPISGKMNTIIAVSTLSLEVTQYASLLYLMQIYRKYYSKKSQAAEKISDYLELDNYFFTPLNSGELSTLFAMEKVSRNKQVADVLLISPNTVNSYIDSLKDKLKSNLNLSIVLNNLRAHRQWKPD